MKLEDEIKQSKFKSEHHKMVLNIIFTAHWVELQNTRMLKPFGISPQQFNILRILRGQYPNPASITLLQDRMMDKMSNASRLVEKLRIKGYIERIQCEEDRRQCDVFISKKGLEILKELDEIIDKQNETFEELTHEEAKIVNELLDKLRK
ncbi:MAG: MarR family transcriptional regulator [Desulfobulbaceae bacterium]|nr:MarR family transcriptional regulator [Candidatus Kapabacteria bacterium]MBS4000886.1 MarR family transcriptional regulator [Desulfobulbaceae bacterium]